MRAIRPRVAGSRSPKWWQLRPMHGCLNLNGDNAKWICDRSVAAS